MGHYAMFNLKELFVSLVSEEVRIWGMDVTRGAHYISCMFRGFKTFTTQDPVFTEFNISTFKQLLQVAYK